MPSDTLPIAWQPRDIVRLSDGQLATLLICPRINGVYVSPLVWLAWLDGPRLAEVELTGAELVKRPRQLCG